MSSTAWKRIAAKTAPDWLESQARGEEFVFRVNYRRRGYRIRKVIPGYFTDWRVAEELGSRILEDEKRKANEKPGIAGKRSDEVLCSDLAVEILREKHRKNRREGTVEQAEIFYRCHILPFLGGKIPESKAVVVPRKAKEGTVHELEWIHLAWRDGACPYAKDLTPQVWNAYVEQFRAKNPDSPLFNHWKFFITLFKVAKQAKLIDPFYRLEYSEDEDDDREEGSVIPDEELQAMIFRATTRTWRHRIIIQRGTGRRPGEIRKLRTKPVDHVDRKGKRETWEPNVFFYGDELVFRFYKYDTKNKRPQCEFVVESELVKRAVRAQMERYPDSPYLFPNERNHEKPMDRCLNGWYATLEAAKITEDYTPHDLRHTYLTEMFKVSKEWATICYQAGLSLDEAEKTYLHFNKEDTREIAKKIAEKTFLAVEAQK